MRGRDPRVRERATAYLAAHGRFTFSIITRYEILRGLRAKRADRQVAGRLISDADILIAATSIVHSLPLVTNNAAHFPRVPGLAWSNWKS